jgi:hypothetical protein
MVILGVLNDASSKINSIYRVIIGFKHFVLILIQLPHNFIPKI